LIGDVDGPFVLDFKSKQAGSSVNLETFSPEDQLSHQLWVFNLIEGSAPETQIVPGKSYRLINQATGSRLCSLSQQLTMRTESADNYYNTWTLYFDAASDLYIGAMIGTAPPATPYYATNEVNLTKGPTVSRLIPDTNASNIFFINPNSNKTGYVITDPGPEGTAGRQITFNKLDPENDKQKWRLEASTTA